MALHIRRGDVTAAHVAAVPGLKRRFYADSLFLRSAAVLRAVFSEPQSPVGMNDLAFHVFSAAGMPPTDAFGAFHAANMSVHLDDVPATRAFAHLAVADILVSSLGSFAVLANGYNQRCRWHLDERNSAAGSPPAATEAMFSPQNPHHLTVAFAGTIASDPGVGDFAKDLAALRGPVRAWLQACRRKHGHDL